MQCMNCLKMEIDKKIIRKLIEVLEDLKKSLKGNEIINSDELVEEKIDDPKTIIKSPIVGTAYLASEPGAKPFTSVGKKIKKGETVLIVEAMKTMNHVPSTLDGVVKKVCVDDGQPVEFGQTIIILE
jgi:acetyl-CoA carboxylase biotin carboxyl carrier protein